MFKINKWNIQPQNNAVTFQYHCDSYGDFDETIIFPSQVNLSNFTEDKILHDLLDVAATYIGVSYYKLKASNDLACDLSLSDTAKPSIEKLYTDGLGEFYIRNNLQYPPQINFTYNKENKNTSNAVTQDNLRTIKSDGVTVAFGGGKDSHVAIALLDKLSIQHELVSIVLASSVKETLKKLSHKDITFIERKIDPKLISLVKEGEGYNGHIPITAINSIILSIYSYLAGNNWVIFSNERGASVATMHHGEHAVNHQYSKSFEFEGLFRNTLNDICGTALQYFSLLRPFSELWIASMLCQEAKAAQEYFSSCNRNFVFEGKNKSEDSIRWCGECSKCIYTAIIMAPHLPKKNFINIFGDNTLNNESNIQIAKDLCGIGNSKPWECVGDFADTASSLMQLTQNEEWKTDIIPQQLTKELNDHYGQELLKNRFQSEINSRTEHFLPDQIKQIADKPS